MTPRVLAFRPRERVEESLLVAEDLGVSLKNVPLVATEPNPGAPVEGLLTALVHGHVDFTVFATRTAFEYLQSMSRRDKAELRALLTRCRLVALDEWVAQDLREYGLRPETPPDLTAEGLLEYLRDVGVADKGVVLIRSARGTRDVIYGLRAEGAKVRDMPLYQLRIETTEAGRQEVQNAVLGGKYAGYAFTDPLTVEAFFQIFGTDQVVEAARTELRAKAVGALDPPTMAALVDWDVEAIQGPQNTFRSLLAALVKRLG